MKKSTILCIIFSIIIVILLGLLIPLAIQYNNTKTNEAILINDKFYMNNEYEEIKNQLAEKELELLSANKQIENLTTELNTIKTERDNLQTKLNNINQNSKTNVTPIPVTVPEEKPQPQAPTPPPTDVVKTAYLTFDDGPSSNTIKILNTLKENNIKATFFINGNYDKEIVQRIINEGHAIGNHTHSHSYKNIYKSADAFLEDFYKLENALFNDFGIRPTIIRFPGGSNNTVSHKYGGKTIMDSIIKTMVKKGYQYFDWSVTSGDADATPATKEQIISNVINRSLKLNNPIVLMHDAVSKKATAEAVPEIIKQLKTAGYTFGVLSETSPTVHFQ